MVQNYASLSAQFYFWYKQWHSDFLKSFLGRVPFPPLQDHQVNKSQNLDLDEPCNIDTVNIDVT